MPSAREPLKVDPAELQLVASRIDGHAGEFLAAHHSTHARAGSVSLGTGLAATALPGMLAAWEADATRYRNQFTANAEGHRQAAASYVGTDSESSGNIDDAASRL
ncbi:type VII secretion target [Mycolicibacterium fortuitum]|uniref:type VII secretion target n=1 Tax=Mycolicibacterium TaxID=1866885 RepID=UPI00320499BC